MRHNRQFVEESLVIATHNKGKFSEIKALFDKFDFTIISADKLGLGKPEETETSFKGNALLKARTAAKASSLPALADDSGLTVTALGDAPGIYSARWAAPNDNFDSAMQRVHDELSKINADNFSAQFVCALAIVWPDGDEVCCEGQINGQIIWPPRGNFGFGYDAIFKPNGYNQSFGEMVPEKKHAMSHRTDAFKKLLKQVFMPANVS